MISMYSAVASAKTAGKSVIWTVSKAMDPIHVIMPSESPWSKENIYKNACSRDTQKLAALIRGCRRGKCLWNTSYVIASWSVRLRLMSIRSMSVVHTRKSQSSNIEPLSGGQKDHVFRMLYVLSRAPNAIYDSNASLNHAPGNVWRDKRKITL